MAAASSDGGPTGGNAIKAIMGLVALTALGMEWTEVDTVKTTMNGISNITFIKRTRVSK